RAPAPGVVAAGGPGAGRPRRRVARAADPPPLLVPVGRPDLPPPPAVAARLVPGPLDPPVDLRVPLDGQRGGVHGDLDGVLVEEAREPPDAGPAAVLVHRLDREIAELVRHRVRDLGHALVARVAVRLRRLGALLVVDDGAECDARYVPPHHARTRRAVADEVARRSRDSTDTSAPSAAQGPRAK